MRNRPIFYCCAAAGALLVFVSLPSKGAGPKGAIKNPDFTRGEPVPEGATHDWNLGPTGMRGWIYSNQMETTEARQILVTKVEKGSPSDGILQPGDVILGVSGQPFAHDPRTELGRAIGEAEATDGALTLMRWREGTTGKVVLPLAVLGRYSPTAPFDCPKSKRIFDQGCEALARQMKANPDQGNPIIRSLNALALLSSGKPEYLPLVRQQVSWASHYSDPERRNLHSWLYGPVNILLAEYTLSTGDRSFLPDLERITMEIVQGQSAVGSWGHRFVVSGGRLGGYGMMNAPGLPLTVSLILARQAGVAHPELDVAIEKSLRLIRFYVGKGSVPYGDHHPWIQTHDDNGYYDLARRWDGTFRHQGPPETRPDSYAGWDSTGAYLLAYAQPLGNIQLAGKKKSLAGQVDAATAESLIADGRGWSPRIKNEAYGDRSEEELFAGLRSWSPVVRERSALELGRRQGNPTPRLITMLGEGDLNARLGACQALGALKSRGASAVPALRNTLTAEDLWLRVKAADALAGIGDAAMPAVPDLLAMLAGDHPESDPRAMQQRYLCFALFDRREGLLKRSLDGVDREALRVAVRAGLQNEDGRARGVLGAVYGQLSYEEIEPLLPAIYQAVVDPAPSGVMFADGIRMSGLEILAKHSIQEGVPLCLGIMDIEGWGKKNRIGNCLKALKIYGGAARDQLPGLELLEGQLKAHPEAKSLQAEIDLVRETMTAIRTDPDPPVLRSLGGR